MHVSSDARSRRKGEENSRPSSLMCASVGHITNGKDMRQNGIINLQRLAHFDEAVLVYGGWGEGFQKARLWCLARADYLNRKSER
jgi:hypothetical protein